MTAPARVLTFEVVGMFQLLAFFGYVEDNVIDDILNECPFGYGNVSVELVTMQYLRDCGWLDQWVTDEQFDLARLTFFANKPLLQCYVELS